MWDCHFSAISNALELISKEREWYGMVASRLIWKLTTYIVVTLRFIK